MDQLIPEMGHLNLADLEAAAGIWSVSIPGPARPPELCFLTYIYYLIYTGFEAGPWAADAYGARIQLISLVQPPPRQRVQNQSSRSAARGGVRARGEDDAVALNGFTKP